MKQLVERSCQITSASGRVIMVERGMVVDYPDKHIHLTPLSGQTIEFATAGEDELYESKYELDDLKDYIAKTYDIPVRVRSRKKLIEKLLDCRFREVSPAELNPIG